MEEKEMVGQRETGREGRREIKKEREWEKGERKTYSRVEWCFVEKRPMAYLKYLFL